MDHLIELHALALQRVTRRETLGRLSAPAKGAVQDDGSQSVEF